jgi:PilZ domain
MKKDKTLKEKRRSVRFRVFSLVKYAPESDCSAYQAENVHDVSRGGLAFFAEEEIKKDVVLKLYFLPPNCKKPVEARGRVVRCPKTTKGVNAFEIGIQFLDISEEARLAIEELEASFLESQKKKRS